MDSDLVILVNEQDEVLGHMEKLEAHQKGLLHRAISIFIFNTKGEWLLQQRAPHKYHSGLLWSNTTCTHPMKGESEMMAATRRLREEMGLKANLTKTFSFKYRADLDNGLIEHELDHIFFGFTHKLPIINREEVAAYRYLSTEELRVELKNAPHHFTEWFKLLFEPVLAQLPQS